jgi:hypothetical protein
VWLAAPNSPDAAALVWNLGWPALAATTVTATVLAVRRRQLRWATAMLASVAISLTIGLAATGFHENAAGVRGLALLLAAMTATAASTVVVYGWHGPR